MYFRVVDGEIKKGDKIKFMASGKEYEVVEVRRVMVKLSW